MTVGGPALGLPPRPAKPRLRGWIHYWSFLVSLSAGAVLVTLAAATVSTRAVLATAIYATTVLGLFGISALYHRRSWVNRRAEYWMNRVDHSMIYLFIAGSYTPFAVLGMSERTGTVVLAVVWGGAITGVVLKMLWHSAPRWLSAPVYIALGWVAVFVLPDILANAGVGALVLLCAGGALYTLGGIVYALRRPDPWPLTFGYHEIFHSCTVLAAICHYIAIWLTMYAAAA